MISRKLLNLVLDQIAKADPVADFAKNLRRNGVTEEQLIQALNGRNDAIAVDLIDALRRA